MAGRSPGGAGAGQRWGMVFWQALGAVSLVALAYLNALVAARWPDG